MPGRTPFVPSGARNTAMSEERTPEELETGLPPFLDTNCIVRYLTDDPPEMAEKAALVIDGMSR